MPPIMLPPRNDNAPDTMVACNNNVNAPAMMVVTSNDNDNAHAMMVVTCNDNVKPPAMMGMTYNDNAPAMVVVTNYEHDRKSCEKKCNDRNDNHQLLLENNCEFVKL